MTRKPVSHYIVGGMECIDALRAIAKSPDHFREFCRLTAFKYLWRCGKKGPPQPDIAKAQDYMAWANESYEGGDGSTSTQGPESWIVPRVPRGTVYVGVGDLGSIRRGERRWVKISGIATVAGDLIVIAANTGSHLLRAQVTDISHDKGATHAVASIRLVNS